MSKFLWNFNEDAIFEATEFLGLKYPVQVRGKRGRKSRGCETTVGIYNGLRLFYGNKAYDVFTHFIVIDRSIDQEEASRAIWHELAHAAQCEEFITDDRYGVVRAFLKFIDDYQSKENPEGAVRRRASEKWDSYIDNPQEVAARAHEDFADDHPLVTETV